MKRSQIVFVTVVFTALLTGFLVEHTGEGDPFGVRFAAPREVVLDPVEVPHGRHELHGLVRSADGAPAPDVTVFLYRAEPTPGVAEPVQWTTTDAEGRFALDELFEATYLATLIMPGHPNVTNEISVPFDGEVAWSLEPPLPPLETLPEIHRADLVGRVLPPIGLEEGFQLADYEVVALPAPSAHPLSGAIVRHATTEADGAFRIERLVAEDYFVQVVPGWARGGSWPVLAEVYLRHEPEPPLDASLSLRLRCGELTGRLVDVEDRPLEGALIKVSLASDPSRIWPPSMSDADGGFTVRDLPEGRYRLRVRSGSDSRELEAAALIGQRVSVTVEPLDPGAAARRDR